MIGGHYKGISDCKMDAFIKAMSTEDVRHLIKWGWVPKGQLVEAYDNIFDEYLQAFNPAKYQILLRRLKDVALLRNKTRLMAMILEVLCMRYNKGLVDVLKYMGCKGEFDQFSDKYVDDLNRVRIFIKKINTSANELEAGIKSGKKEEHIKESDFDEIISVLSKYQGYRIDKKLATVSEFVHIYKRFVNENKKKDGK